MSATQKYITLEDPDGGAPVQVPVVVLPSGLLSISAVTVTGITPSTAGVADSLNKRFVTDAELATAAALAGLDGPILGIISAGATIVQLASMSMDMNAAPAQTLFTVPALTHYVVTHIIVRAPSINLTTVSFSIGYTGAGYTDMVADATHVALSAADKYVILTPIAGSHVGAAGDVLKLLDHTLQGAPATAQVDIYGYIF